MVLSRQHPLLVAAPDRRQDHQRRIRRAELCGLLLPIGREVADAASAERATRQARELNLVAWPLADSRTLVARRCACSKRSRVQIFDLCDFIRGQFGKLSFARTPR